MYVCAAESWRSRVEAKGRCDLTPNQSAALWRSKIVHITLLPVMTLVSTWRISFSGSGQLVWVFILLLVAGLIEEIGGSTELEEDMVDSFGKGGSTARRTCNVICSFLTGTIVAVFMLGISYEM